MNGRELADMLGVSAQTITDWHKAGMPCRVQGTRGRAAQFDLADCLRWLDETGKGFTVRRDRPGGSTRVPDLVSAQVAEPERFTEAELKAAAGTQARRALSRLLRCTLNNFPILAAALIEFGGIEPGRAVDLAFIQAGTMDTVLRELLTLQGIELDDGNEPIGGRVGMYFDGQLPELAGIAEELRELWEAGADAEPGV